MVRVEAGSAAPPSAPAPTRLRTFSSLSSSCCSSRRSPDFLRRLSQKLERLSAVLTLWMSLLTNSSKASFIAFWKMAF